MPKQTVQQQRNVKEAGFVAEPVIVSNDTTHRWIRGVNIGGWLLMERYITPYAFAITDCHVRGDFCWYPGQIDAPPEDDPSYQLCDLYKCKPLLQDYDDSGNKGYPLDEYTLSKAFNGNTATAAQWLNYHFEHFVTRDDLVEIKASGATHVRVPLPHWILDRNNNNARQHKDDEPWVPGDRWLYFVRFSNWCREMGLEVWPDLHTAPGSQNGFDNSGHFLRSGPTCEGWAYNQEHVKQTIKAVGDIAKAIKDDGLSDIVTGFGVLNEPFRGCDEYVVRSYYDAALEAVRTSLGPKTAVYIADIFEAEKFNDGFWQNNSTKYANTFLDSHYYHVFAETTRSLSPRQQIAFVCRKNYLQATSCCYDDAPKNTKPATAMKRMFGEWSVSFDVLVSEKLEDLMKGIAKNAKVPEYDREISPKRQEFLNNFAKAQILAYEAAEIGTSVGWFYWNFKMEGGAFAEWDFLRGIKEGWLPKIPSPTTPSAVVFNTTCNNIILDTDDNRDVVHEFPDPKNLPENTWIGPPIDDDVVLSHGDNLKNGGRGNFDDHGKFIPGSGTGKEKGGGSSFFGMVAFVFFGYAIWHVFMKGRKDRSQYTQVGRHDLVL